LLLLDSSQCMNVIFVDAPIRLPFCVYSSSVLRLRRSFRRHG
jgi:hypothetical protein